MKLVATLTSDGTMAVAGAVVVVVSPFGTIGRGKVVQGQLVASAELGAVWGLLVDGRPIAAFVVSVDGETVDLGELIQVPEGWPIPQFHAKDGLVFAVPRSLRALRANSASRLAANVPGVTEKGATFGGLVGSVAQQIGGINSLKSGVSLMDAKVSLKGIPMSSSEALGLNFPSADVAATGVGLSELAFTLKPERSVSDSGTPPTTATVVPDVVGYTRDLAVRKLSKTGLVADTVTQLVSLNAQNGRILRQVPVPGTAVSPGAIVRLFLGKQGAP